MWVTRTYLTARWPGEDADLHAPRAVIAKSAKSVTTSASIDISQLPSAREVIPARRPPHVVMPKAVSKPSLTSACFLSGNYAVRLSVRAARPWSPSSAEQGSLIITHLAAPVLAPGAWGTPRMEQDGAQQQALCTASL